MKKQYLMEHRGEAKRLEEQSKAQNFSIEQELDGVFTLKSGSVLDAGCGSGLALNYLNENYPDLDTYGCDISEDRIEFADSSVEKSKFFVTDLKELSKHGQKYNCIINRYVAHHMSVDNYKQVLSEFKNSLEPSGEVIIIDVDGVLQNIGTTNTKLLTMIDKVLNHFSGNVNMARVIPSLLKEVGFKDIQYKVETLDFQGEEKEVEIAQYEQRIEFGKQLYLEALGSEFEFQHFKKLFFEEIKHSPVFYNKFVIKASL